MGGAPYRELAPEPPDPYLAVWTDLQRRQKMGCVFPAVWVLGGTALLALQSRFLSVPFMLVVFGGSLYFGRSPLCPNCEKSLYPSGWIKGRRDKCGNCGIPFGTLKRDLGPRS